MYRRCWLVDSRRFTPHLYGEACARVVHAETRPDGRRSLLPRYEEKNAIMGSV